MRIAVRLDDITPDMDWHKFNTVKNILHDAGISPLAGIVPDNMDPNLHKQEPKDDFWTYFAGLRDEEGWCIAQHGYTHVYTTKDGGLFPLNRFSEFAGLSYDRQLDMIKSGRDILKKNGLDTDIFMTPAHSYDHNTLKALRECGFRFVTDGFGRYPYIREGLVFIPIPFRLEESLGSRGGFSTMVLHVNTMDADDIDRLQKRLEKYSKRSYEKGNSTSYFIDYSEILNADYIKRGHMGDADEYMMAQIKHTLVSIRGSFNS